MEMLQYKFGDGVFLSLDNLKPAANVWEKFAVSLYSPAEQMDAITDITVHFLPVHPAYENQSLYSMKDIPDIAHVIQRNRTLLFADESWRDIYITSPIMTEDVDMLICQIFYIHAVQRGFIHTHSSLIDFQGRGILFLGPSGIGKTTQAELWRDYRDALIINGDMAFVQRAEDGVYGWGTPWHGSSPYCENTKVKLEALVVLKQSEENKIRSLEGFEKVKALSKNVFYPRLTENGMELCLDIMDHLLNTIPVYELSCRPDEDAVRLVEKTVF